MNFWIWRTGSFDVLWLRLRENSTANNFESLQRFVAVVPFLPNGMGGKPSLPRSDPNGPTVFHLIVPLSRRPTDTISRDHRGWNRTLNENRIVPPDNNPQQYCGRRGVKLMSMFPFIEWRITASGGADVPISDCQRSVCAPPIIAGQPWRGRGVNSHWADWELRSWDADGCRTH